MDYSCYSKQVFFYKSMLSVLKNGKCRGSEWNVATKKKRIILTCYQKKINSKYTIKYV